MHREALRTVVSMALWGCFSCLAASTVWAAQSTETTRADTMVVTATRVETPVQNAPGSISVIEREAIEESPGRDLVDILSETPGISLAGQGVGGRKTISIRGADNRHTLILVDGRRIAASDAVMGHSNFENSWVPVESIERIEVVRGPLSALYGSEALGGVINIITKAPTQDWHGSVKIGGGVPDDRGGETSNIAFNIAGPLIRNKVGFSLGFDYLHENATPDEDQPRYSEIEGREVISVSPKIFFTPNDAHRFELFANIVDEERDLMSSSRGRDQGSEYELDKYLVGINWSGIIGPTESKVNLYRSQTDKLSIKTYLDTHEKSKAPDKVTNDILDFQTSMQLPANRVTVGGEYRKETVEAESLANAQGEEEVTHKALFVQDEIDLFGGKLLLTPGLRYDDHEYFGSETSPRIYLLYKLTSALNLKAGYGQAFNAPTAKQVSPDYNASTGPHTFIGNPEVDPETSKSYEMGLEYYGDAICAKVFFFNNDIEDMIAYRRVGSTGPGGRFAIYQADNIDKARLRGVETELSAKLPRNLDLTLGYNYLDAEDTQNHEALSGRPEHSVSVKLKHHLPPLGLDSVLRYQYVGNQSFENDAAKMERISGYSLWHLAFTKKLTTHFELQLGIENIGDVRLADKSNLIPYTERGRYFYSNLRGRF